jgi:hypothetical protein
VAEETFGLPIIGFNQLAELGIDPLCAKRRTRFHIKEILYRERRME